MELIRLHHIGIAVQDLPAACIRFEHLFGLKAQDFRDDHGGGMQHDARILLGNECWLHLVHNWNPKSRVYQFLEQSGEGLEHIALQTGSIEADVQHLRDIGVSIYRDKIFDAPDGFEAFIYPDQTPGVNVELIQPHTTSRGYSDDSKNAQVNDKIGFIRLHHIGVAVKNLQAAFDRFEHLFDLKGRDIRNDHGGGMQHDA